MIRILTCDNLSEAYLIKGNLNNEGIDCILTNQYFTTLMPLYNNMLGAGIQVLVREEDVTKAKEILKDNIEPNNEELVCPNCGSIDIGLGLGKNKFQKFLNIVLAIFTAMPIGNLKPKFYCKHCKEEIK
jgi:hypothetical protein